MANRAASKLLGYSKRELLTKSRATIFDINEDSFKQALKQRKAEGQTKALVTAIKKSGQRFPCEITSAVFMDEDGIENAISTIEDMSQSILKQKNIDTRKEEMVAENIVQAKSEQKKIDTKKEKVVAGNIILAQAKSDAKLEENNEWIKYIAETSYDVMWDWNIATGEIYVGDSIEEVFGYKVQNNTISFTDFSNSLLPKEKDAVEKNIFDTLSSGNNSWKDSYKLRCHDGSVAATTSRASIVRDAEGKAINLIGATKDVSKQQQLEKKLAEQITIQDENSEVFHKELEDKLEHEIATNVKLFTEYKERFQHIFNTSSDVLFDIDLVENEIIISNAYEKEFGYKITANMTPAKDWVSHIHPDDKEAVMKDYLRVLASDKTEWKFSYRFLRADNSVANILSNRIILRNANGKAYRMIGSMHDISKQKVLEEKLEQEINLKEKQIAEAMYEAKETERSDIGKELHDNINQLLAASKMYIDMAKRGGKNSEMYLSRSSQYTLTAIEEIRKLTKGLTTDTIKSLGLCEAIDNLIRDTMEANPLKISYRLENFTENCVNDKFKRNVFRIVQEQLNNILKHAKATVVTINLSQNKQSIKLTISDNGVGFDTNQKREGIGITNIKSRAASYDGIADFASESGKGCALTVTFPVTDALLNKN